MLQIAYEIMELKDKIATLRAYTGQVLELKKTKPDMELLEKCTPSRSYEAFGVGGTGSSVEPRQHGVYSDTSVLAA